ncbi:SCO4402 family protein [Streptomyces araujoniae]|uniref:SCO4402 family protein n=1 Tax=Streptomyces sp. ZEA17I TaxID=2202516 RepID=UPI00215A6ACC|nr:hypothetical protein [Streptomyces sp. ZEA17I]
MEFSDARIHVSAALQSLGDEEYQSRVWIAKDFPKGGASDDLSLVIHILYDDFRVLEDPEAALGEVLRNRREVAAMRRLADLMDPLIEELGDAPDETYLAAPSWGLVVRAARAALDAMEAFAG